MSLNFSVLILPEQENNPTIKDIYKKLILEGEFYITHIGNSKDKKDIKKIVKTEVKHILFLLPLDLKTVN